MGDGEGDGDGGSTEKERGGGEHCGRVGKPERHPSPSLNLLKASEHLANCSSPRDANEINSAKCSSGHLQRAWCQVSTWSNPVLLLLLLSSSCPFLMIPHPLLFTQLPHQGTPHLQTCLRVPSRDTRNGGHVTRETSKSEIPWSSWSWKGYLWMCVSDCVCVCVCVIAHIS